MLIISSVFLPTSTEEELRINALRFFQDFRLQFIIRNSTVLHYEPIVDYNRRAWRRVFFHAIFIGCFFNHNNFCAEFVFCLPGSQGILLSTRTHRFVDIYLDGIFHSHPFLVIVQLKLLPHLQVNIIIIVQLSGLAPVIPLVKDLMRSYGHYRPDKVHRENTLPRHSWLSCLQPYSLLFTSLFFCPYPVLSVGDLGCIYRISFSAQDTGYLIYCRWAIYKDVYHSSFFCVCKFFQNLWNYIFWIWSHRISYIYFKMLTHLLHPLSFLPSSF